MKHDVQLQEIILLW